MSRFIAFTLFILLQACSFSDSNSYEESDINREELQQLLVEWDTKKEQIDHLNTIEADLLMLIQALAVQVDVDKLPKKLQSDPKVVSYGSTEQVSTTVNQNLNEVTNTASPTHGVKIGSYLVERGVRAQLGQLKNRYPNLYTMLNYKMNTQSSASKTLYSLVAGPLQTEQEANKLCQVFELIYSHCETTEFKGVNL